MTSTPRVVSIADFMRTDLDGTVDFEMSKAVFEDLVASCKESSVDRILLDIREVTGTDIEVSDIFSLVMHLLSLDLTLGFRMAIVNRPKDNVDRAKIFEQCAKEHGIQVATFKEFEEALTWLNGGEL